MEIPLSIQLYSPRASSMVDLLLNAKVNLLETNQQGLRADQLTWGHGETPSKLENSS